ncbi:hypothetical protein ACGF0D_12870 [Kitasatospora sp. NPDC048298]|uniref:hypothetical protein n=1 Tax=Kitasatospora sp. NPDC048298 TaxID=3364049 RepID=UPI00372193C0
MGDGLGPASDAVAALLGDGPHQAVADVLRARLRMVPEGARALAAAEASPGDAQARALLTAAVAHLLASDPAFAHYLATTGLGKPGDPPTVQLRGEPGTVQLRLGPPSAPPPKGPTTVHLRTGPADARARAFAARRSGTGIVVALALVLVAALAALGVHLASRPLLKPGGPDLAHAARPLDDPRLVARVLPDEGTMTGGWRLRLGPTAGIGSGSELPCLLPDSCDRQLAYGVVTYGTDAAQTAEFDVVTFASPEAATRAFRNALDRAGDPKPSTAVPLIGDQGAVRVQDGRSAVAVIRVGSVLLLVRVEAPGADLDTSGFLGLARLAAERARQVQEGQLPDSSWPTATRRD